MKVGLIQIDGKIPNLALMKLATWHKQRGDDITILDISSLEFDRIYGSKIFMGGPGYDLKSELPPEIEAVVPDYDLFKLDYSIGFTTRGCIRDCGFCIVQEKEGMIRETPMDWIKNTKIVVLDNNFLASSKWKEKLQYFIDNECKVSFMQGIDIRLVNEENAKLLSKIKFYESKFRFRRLCFSFDDPSLDNAVRKGVDILNKAGIPNKKLMIYVLVGYNTIFEQDQQRVNTILSLGCAPYIMPYNNKVTPQLRRFTRWVNGRYYRMCKWEEFDQKMTHLFYKKRMRKIKEALENKGDGLNGQ